MDVDIVEQDVFTERIRTVLPVLSEVDANNLCYCIQKHVPSLLWMLGFD